MSIKAYVLGNKWKDLVATFVIMIGLAAGSWWLLNKIKDEMYSRSLIAHTLAELKSLKIR
jgi:uncharacterized membrane protein YqjE